MKSYNRVMLGKGSAHAPACFNGGFIGADFDIEQDLTHSLPEEWREFNKKFIPIHLATHPDETRIGAGLACGALRTVAKGIRKGEIVLSPDECEPLTPTAHGDRGRVARSPCRARCCG